MNHPDQLSARLSALIAAGAHLHTYRGAPAVAVGAAHWLEGRGLLYAEMWAEHQGHVHLLEAARFAPDGPALDFFTAAGELAATLVPLDAVELTAFNFAAWQERRESEAWQAFWAAELEAAQL